MRPAKTVNKLGGHIVCFFMLQLKFNLSHDTTKPKKWVFTHRCAINGSLKTQSFFMRRADAQADLSLCWAHTYFVCFVMSWLKWWYASALSERHTNILGTFIRVLKLFSGWESKSGLVKFWFYIHLEIFSIWKIQVLKQLLHVASVGIFVLVYCLQIAMSEPAKYTCMLWYHKLPCA